MPSSRPPWSSASHSNDAAPKTPSRAQSRRFFWTTAGAAIGLFDFGVLLFFDANLTIAGHDLTIPMFLLFIVPYAALGWAVGGLILARKCAEEDHQTIEVQYEALERAQRALVQEEKLAGIGRLAAGVAHEVRNPLGVIRASASMVQENFESGTDAHRALGFVCDETDRLDRLIHALLTFAKPQPVERVPTDLAKAIHQATQLAEPEAKRLGVEIDLTLEKNLPTIQADPDRLSQAIYGLMLNAIQAFGPASTPESATDDSIERDATGLGRRVEVQCLPNEDSVQIRVKDSGPGIPETMRDQIFEPFVTTKSSGTGLGLPMALRLIEAQGGQIELEEPESGGSHGASFRIDLPQDRIRNSRAA